MPRFNTQLSGSHVLVTGGTKGIGKAIVEAFLAEGANVSYCSRSAVGNEFVHFKDAIDGARAIGSSVNVASEAAIQEWVGRSASEFGRIDVVVANAAPFYMDATIEHWKKSFQADMIGLISLIEAAAPYLKERNGHGSIVVMSSLAGYEARSLTLTGPYGPLKRAQSVLAKSYSHKLGPEGVRVNTLTPGVIETPSLTLPDGTVELSTFQKIKQDVPAMYEQLVSQIPPGKAGTVEDVANAAVFLGSPLSRYISGATLSIDGAMSTSF